MMITITERYREIPYFELFPLGERVELPNQPYICEIIRAQLYGRYGKLLKKPVEEIERAATTAGYLRLETSLPEQLVWLAADRYFVKLDAGYVARDKYSEVGRKYPGVCSAARIGVERELTTAYYEQACAAGNVRLVKWLYANGCPRGPDEMYFAAMSGDLELMRWLFRIKYKTESYLTDPQIYRENIHPQYHFTRSAKFPMVAAAAGGHVDCIDWLYEHRYVKGDCINLAIDAAAKGGHVAAIIKLHGYRVEFMYCSPDAINSAAKAGHVECIELLYTLGYESNMAIAYAAGGGKLECIKWLYEHGKKSGNYAAAGIAAREGHVACVDWLVANGSGTKDIINGAVEHGDLNKLIYFYSKNYTDPNLPMMFYAKRSWHFSLITLAASCGHLSIVKWLHEISPERVELVMVESITSKNLELIMWLDENGYRDDRALLKAIQIGDLEIAQLLYGRGYRIPDLFQSALYQGHLAIIKWLYSIGHRGNVLNCIHIEVVRWAVANIPYSHCEIESAYQASVNPNTIAARFLRSLL